MAVEIKIPNVGESITEVTLSKWLVEEGDYVEIDQEICELDSDKATLELPSEAAGTIKFIATEGEDLEIGAIVCEIDTSAKAPQAKESKTEVPVSSAEVIKQEVINDKMETSTHAAGQPSPAAAKLIRENSLDTNVMKGSGKDGRITKQDVLNVLANGDSDSQLKTVEAPSIETTTPPAKPFSRETSRENMSRLRRTIADKLVAAKNDTAMLTTFNEVNMEPIMSIRKQYKEKFKETHQVNLGFMSFFAKAVCHALNEFPTVNAMLDGKEIIYHNYCDISIAVSTPRGLVVPVIRNAESLSMKQIEARVMDLAVRGRNGQLDLDEMTGGTFTITNGGVFGSLMSTPIINTPQSAILGMHKIEERPIAINGKVVIKPMMYLALSYDHRVIDGKESVTFLVRVKEFLENPEHLLLGDDPIKKLLEL